VELSLRLPQSQCSSLQMRLHDLLAGEVYFMTHEN